MMPHTKKSRIIRHCLVIEDNLDHFSKINSYLTKNGYRCSRAKTENELREALSKSSPELQ